MNVRTLNQTTITLLLIGLLSFHVFHLVVAWKNSKVAIIDASYGAPRNMAFESRAMKALLIHRLEADKQLVEGFSPIFYIANGMIYVSFATHDLNAEPVLRRLEMDMNDHFHAECGEAIPSTGGATRRTSISLRQWEVRFNAWIKPVDILSLLVLIGALIIWIKGTGRDAIQ